MDPYTLPASIQRRPQARNRPNSIVIEKAQSRLSRSGAPSALQLPNSPETIYEDGDTPKASEHNLPSPGLSVSSVATSLRTNSFWSKTSSRDSICSATSYNSIFDAYDDECQTVPFRLSTSLKLSIPKTATPESPASPAIPSPSQWPTIQKLQKQLAGAASLPLSPVRKVQLSPAALAKLNVAETVTANKNATPSLTASPATDDHHSMSCPSTPDSRQLGDDDSEWAMPVQLPRRALSTLQHLSTDENHLSQVTDEPVEAKEMQDRGIGIDIVLSPAQGESGDLGEPISAISVPSPGGFFASLDSQSRMDWNLPPQESVPSTSTAVQFYGLPWTPEPRIKEHIIEVQDFEILSDGPSTAKQSSFERRDSSEDVKEIDVKEKVHEYDENYAQKLVNGASSNTTRTNLWLSAQASYLTALKSANPVNRKESLDFASPRQSTSNESVVSPKTCVSSATSNPFSAVKNPLPPRKDSLFYHAFQHLRNASGKQDAVQHAEQRDEALHMQRVYLPENHRSQLKGDYHVKNATVQADTGFETTSTSGEDVAATANKAIIAAASEEREAVEQVKISSWNLDGMRHLNNGSLLDKPALEAVSLAKRRGRAPRILDLDGAPNGDWGWAVSLEHRNAKVYTAIPELLSSPTSPPTTSAPIKHSHRGPSNHRTVSFSHAWSLPFPSNTFDVISARTLHMLLRTTKPSRCSPRLTQPFAELLPADLTSSSSAAQSSIESAYDAPDGDEYTATLSELHRVLRDDGVLSFSLMDAEPLLPSSTDSTLAALAVDFATNLAEAGYDAKASCRFLPRLTAAGFGCVKRAWTILPLDVGSDNAAPKTGEMIGRACGSVNGDVVGATSKPALLTGLVGSLAWEKWMLKLQTEMSVPENRQLEGVANAWDEVRRLGGEQRVGLGFRSLVGWAKK